MISRCRQEKLCLLSFCVSYWYKWLINDSILKKEKEIEKININEKINTKYDVATDDTNDNVDNEQKQQEGTSNASSDKPSPSSSSEILLPAPVLPNPDIVFVMPSKQGVHVSVTPLKERKQKANKGVNTFRF